MAIVSTPDGLTRIEISIGSDYSAGRHSISKFWKKINKAISQEPKNFTGLSDVFGGLTLKILYYLSLGCKLSPIGTSKKKNYTKFF